MIVTFYSFKGGVGRTFSLVETAVQLAEGGASVVVWDLDLEAPGLQKIPSLQGLEAGLTTGTLDLLAKFEATDYTFPSREQLREALVRQRLPASDNYLSFLLPAPLDESYPAKFSHIGWETLFAAEGAGPAFFHKVAAVLEEDFDYLLIDSRTGFTDLSAICTLQLPDLVVLVFNLNEQNLAGIERVHKAASQVPARTAETQNVPVLLLANMIPEERLDLVEEKLAILREKGLSPHYRVPLHPALLLTDEIPSLMPSPGDTARLLAPLTGAIETRRRDLEEDQERAEAETRRRRGAAEKARSFEDRVAELFALQGHRVTRGYRRGDLEADLRLEIPVGTLPISVLVECKSGRPATVQDVREFARKLQAFQDLDKNLHQGILITLAGIPLRVEEEARQIGLVLQSWRQLLASLVEPIPLDPAIHAFQGTSLERLYVELEIIRESDLRPGRVPEPRDATPDFRRWLNRTGAGLFLLLGEVGSGKTCFCRRIAAELAVEAQNERADRKDSSARVPLHVDLRGAAAGTLETLLLQHLQRVAPKAQVSSPALLHANREGLLVLFFDGFDEALVAPPQGSMDLLRELLRAVEGKAKVVLTCRPHLFRDRLEMLPGRPLPPSMASRPATPLYEDVRERKDVEVAYLLDLREERVEEYLRKALPPPGDWQMARSLIRETAQLAELSVRPFFLEIIVAALPHLLERGASSADLARLYEVYGQAWFASDHRGALDRARRTALVELLARLAWNAPQAQVHYETLATKAAMHLGDARPLSPDTIDFELRTAPFLHRNAEGFYIFVHRSFLEFFVARALRSCIAREVPGCLDLLPVTREVVYFLESWPEAELIPDHTGRILETTYTPARSENALHLLYLHARATVGLLATSWLEELDSEQLDRIRTAFARLRPESLNLAGADLDGTVLPGVDLRGAHLESARLARADLRGAGLEDAFLAGADLRFARLRHAGAARADFTAAVLDHADLRDADLSNANLRQADLTFARMARSRLRDTALENCQMRGAGLLGATLSPWALRQKADLGSTHPELTFRPQFGPTARTTALAWNPHHRCLATITGETCVAIWDVEAGEQLLCWTDTSKKYHALAWSPHGRWLALAAARKGRDTLELWDAVSGEIVQTLVPQEPVGCLAWSPTGKVLALSHRDAGTIAVWEMTPGEAAPAPALRWSSEEGEPARSLVWSPDGNTLTATTAAGTVRFWNALTLQAHNLDLSPRTPVALIWSPDGDVVRVVLREGGVETVIAESRLRVGGYEAPPPPIDTAAWAPAGDRLAVTAGGTLRVADLGACAASLELRWENAEEILTGWAPDGSLLAVAAGNRPVEIWRAGSWEPGTRFQPYEAISPSAFSWSPHGKHLAIGLSNGRTHLWDLTSGKPAELGADSEAPVLCLIWGADGANLLAIRADATTCAINPPGQTARSLERLGAGKLLAAAAPSEGRQIVILLEDGHSVALYEPGTAQPLRQAARTESRILAFALSAKNALALACDDGTVQIWNTVDSGLAESTHGNSQKTVSLAWSPEGRRLAAGTQAGLIRLRDLEGHRPIILSGHENRILAIAWSPLGDQIASAAGDGMVLIWDATTGSRLQAFPAPGRVSALAWAPEGGRLTVVHETGVEVRDAQTGVLRASLYTLAGGPLAVTGDGYVSGPPDALGAVRFGDGWALYEMEDVPERLSPERVAAALRPTAAGH